MFDRLDISMAGLSGLKYLGGKNSRNASGSGRWVASQLPTCDVYVEPFCGMLGVLLQRSPAKLEVASDADKRVTNWWEVVRDDNDNLARLIADTPYSEHVWDDVKAEYDNRSIFEKSKLYQAWAFTVLLEQSFSAKGTQFGRSWTTPVVRIPFIVDKIRQLKERLQRVHLYNLDALEILERTKDKDRHKTLIYCDPPYQTSRSTNRAYATDPLDIDRMSELLLAQKGMVAVSGYPGEWDHLGWRLEQKTGIVEAVSHTQQERTECLWLNFPTQDNILTQN